jgi:hypothetical protein
LYTATDCYERDIEIRHPAAAMLASAGFLKPLRASSTLAEAGEDDEFAGKGFVTG